MSYGPEEIRPILENDTKGLDLDIHCEFAFKCLIELFKYGSDPISAYFTTQLIENIRYLSKIKQEHELYILASEGPANFTEEATKKIIDQFQSNKTSDLSVERISGQPGDSDDSDDESDDGTVLELKELAQLHEGSQGVLKFKTEEISDLPSDDERSNIAFNKDYDEQMRILNELGRKSSQLTTELISDIKALVNDLKNQSNLNKN